MADMIQATVTRLTPLYVRGANSTLIGPCLVTSQVPALTLGAKVLVGYVGPHPVRPVIVGTLP